MSGGTSQSQSTQTDGPVVRNKNVLDRFILGIGRFIAWSAIILVFIIILQVVLRYGFHSGFVFFEELQWHLYALGIMFGLSYAQINDTHIRVDVLRMGFSETKQRVIEIIGIVVLLLPFCWIAYQHGLDFVADSWRVNESSDAPLGLCCRWGIKSVLPASFLLLALAGVSRILHDLDALIGWKLFGRKVGQLIAPVLLLAALLDLARYIWPVKEELLKRITEEAIMPLMKLIAG